MNNPTCNINTLLERMRKADLKSGYVNEEDLRSKETEKIGLSDKQKRIRQLKTGFNTW